MKIILILTVSISFFLLTGCVKILNSELKSKETKMVLNAAISTDSVFTVNVSRTFNIFENESENNLPFINGANVRLFENDNYLFNLDSFGYGYYRKSDFYPEAGKQYRITVSYGSYKNIESIASVPHMVPIVAFDTSSIIAVPSYGGTETEYTGKITYNDPPDTTNYYQLTCMLYIYNGPNLLFAYQQGIWPTDENSRFFDGEYNGNLLWSDKLTNGQQVSFSFVYYSSYEYELPPDRDQQRLKFEFRLQSLTKEYFTYLKSLGIYWETGGSDNPFSEPVVIYSNVDNGYGIFGAYSQDTTSVSFLFDNNDGGKP